MMSRLPSRLLMGGLLLYGGLWWLLDRYHDRDLALAMDHHMASRLEQKAERDGLRLGALLREHQALTSILAQSDGARREAAAVAGSPVAEPRIMDGEPPWLMPFGERRVFPPTGMIVITDKDGRFRRIWRVDGAVVPASIDATLPRIPRVDGAGFILVNGVPMMVSAAALGGAASNDELGQLIQISQVDSGFLIATLGRGLDRGFVLTVSEARLGRILASSNPAEVPVGAVLGEQLPRYRISAPNLNGQNVNGSGIVFTSLLERSRHGKGTEPVMALDLRYRIGLGAITALLFLGSLAYVVLRIRRLRARIAGLGGRVCGVAGRRRAVDELAGLEADVEHLVKEVERTQAALVVEEKARTRLLTERIALETENDRLILLQAVTEEMEVGVIRIGPDGPRSENAVMLRFAEAAGGVEPFIQARMRGESRVAVGSGDTELVFQVLLARQIDAGLLLVRKVVR